MMLKKVMRKNLSRNNYTIDINKDDDVDESNFYHNEKGKFVGDVIILFEDEYDTIIQENQSLKDNLQELQSTIEAKDSQIKHLCDEVDKKTQSNNAQSQSFYKELNDKTSTLKQDKKKLEDTISTMKTKHQEELQDKEEIHKEELINIGKDHKKELDNLQGEYSKRIDELEDALSTKDNEIHSIELKYAKEIASLKEEHQKELNDLTLFDEEYHMKISDHEKEMSKMKDTLVQLRMQDYQDNKQYRARLRKLGFFEKHSSKYDKILDEMEANDDKKIAIKGDDLLKIASPDKD